MNDAPLFLGLLRPRRIILPTWRAWLVLAVLTVLLVTVVVRSLYPFLSPTVSKPGGLLIVEGWLPDYAFPAAIEEFRSHPYTAMLVSGGAIDKGAPFIAHATWADLGAATLIKMGFDPAKVRAVPAPAVQQDRTYASAVAIREMLWREGAMPATINVVSVGPHSRRTWMLYEAAFGGSTDVGIIAVEDQGFDGARWWTSSAGFRAVTGELIAYVYARLLFRPRKEALP